MSGVCFDPVAVRANSESELLILCLVSICMFGFGLVMICQGLVTNWGGLMTTRFLLGLFESGMFPGCELHFLKAALEAHPNFFSPRFLPPGNVV